MRYAALNRSNQAGCRYNTIQVVWRFIALCHAHETLICLEGRQRSDRFATQAAWRHSKMNRLTRRT